MDCLRRNNHTRKFKNEQILILNIIDSLLNQFQKTKIVFITKQELESLLKIGTILRQEDTVICQDIRLLRANTKYWIQETSPKDEIILRQFDTIETAEIFLKNRLQVYEKMWDGCGCKIDYYQ